MSSVRAVSVERHWLRGEVKVWFATVVGGGERGSTIEVVLCNVTVTFEGKMLVREVCADEGYGWKEKAVLDEATEGVTNKRVTRKNKLTRVAQSTDMYVRIKWNLTLNPKNHIF